MTGMVATVYGRLGKQPRPVTTKTDTAMAIGSMAVDTSHQKNPDSTTWVSLVCFGRNAEMLLACPAGEMLSATGRVQVHKWQSDTGADVEQLQVVVDTLHSARTIRAKTSTAPKTAPRAKAKPPLKVPPGSWPMLVS